ncbi:VCBS repeat-containing protein [Flavobacteriaceae bacterium 14752]|uniref:VCBS repeat-containing protein n=1 Tax=Mesohalobacter salilacus TaxID=2491711 RepID=UPI000F640D7D|nr:CRTAC1 family protein [Flavobacteriaceae bacterium 14752]
MKQILGIIIILSMLSCQDKNTTAEKTNSKQNIPENPVFELLSSQQTGIDFVNTIQNKEDFNIFRYRNFYNGGGVGIGDINNDGLEDIYFTANQGQNKLYLNKGNFQFEDITKKAKVAGSKAWSTGVAFVDINQDGLLDIYVCNAGNQKGDDQKNELFINQGDLTFKEEAQQYGLDESGFTTHAAFFDYDNDGDLDVYILNNSFIPVSSLSFNNKRELRAKDWNLPEDVKGGGDKLLENRDGKFVDVSEKAGIYGSLIGFGLGVTVGDVNHDGYKDLYISNDFYERDYLYVNQGNGTFKEDIMNRSEHTSLSSMGADMADINNDGHYEIFSTDMLPEGDARLKTTTNFENYDLQQLKISRGFYNQFMQNALQFNDGTGHFKEIALFSGVAKTDWSWGALLFDMNNDSYKDLYVSNGIKQDLTNQDFIDFFADEVYQKMAISGKKTAQDSIINIMPSHPISNYAFINQGDLTFKNKTYDLGFDIKSFSNGAAYADLDQDGDLDLVVNNIDSEAFVFQNNSEDKNYLNLNLKFKTPNVFGIGTLVNAFVDNQIISNEVMPTRGFQSSVTYQLHFGLGDKQNIDSLHVIWPNAKFQTLKNIKANQNLNVSYDSLKTSDYNYSKPQSNSKLFDIVKPEIKSHKEDFYVDFDHEGLIFKMQSREGPTISLGDINGDGRDDVFMGGAKGQAAQLFNLKGENISSENQRLFNEMSKYEDTASVFADIDNDGDLDLILGAGGNFKDETKQLYNIRILKNNGQGIFELFQSLPNPYNTSVIQAYDFDQDGDEDLFIGNFSVPGTYGIDPKSKLLENDGNGEFTDITEQKAYDFKDLGMVKDAIWHDFNNDGIDDLVVVGEWMHPMFFKNNGRRLEQFDTNLNPYKGLFNAVMALDLNKDGQKELVFGNYGQNFKLQPSLNQPAKLFINDFDDNGTIEQIITRSINGKDKPYQLKRELANQIPNIKKDNMSYKKFAEQSIADLFGKDKVNQAITKELTELASFVAFKTSANEYNIKYLPQEAQWSSIHALNSIEIDDDAFILAAGNFYHFKPQFARLDASHGHLIGFKQDNFYLKKDTNFKINGEVRSLKTTTDKNNNHFILVGRNNDKPLIFRYEE